MEKQHRFLYSETSLIKKRYFNAIEYSIAQESEDKYRKKTFQNTAERKNAFG